jgi:hypothetical protein
MKILRLPKLLLLASVVGTFFQSCKDDAYLQTPPAVVDQSFTEGCDSSAAMLARGWKFINNSYPRGGGVWQNGGDATAPFFNPFSSNGANAGFIGAGVNSTNTPTAADAAPNVLPTAPKGFVSNYLISPKIIMQNGDKIVFYTRAQLVPGNPQATGQPVDSSDWGNRLQVKLNIRNTGLDVGNIKNYWSYLYGGSTSRVEDNAGHFDVTILDINPFTYEWHKIIPGTSLIDNRPFNATTNSLAYPIRWTRFEAKVSGLDGPTEGRFAFRYYVPGGDPNNGYATGIGIDNIEYISVNK